MTASLNRELRGAGLFCGESRTGPPCPDGSFLGYLSPLEVREQGNFLTVRTGIGSECGFDESAYLFNRRRQPMRLVWRLEQTSDREPGYRPLELVALRVSKEAGRGGECLVLAVGLRSSCGSTWRQIDYRVFRVDVVEGESIRLLAALERGNIGDGMPDGAASADGIHIEFQTGSVDSSLLTRLAVRRFRVVGDRVQRVDPVALGPSGFVDEWLSLPWEQAAAWSEAAGRDALRGAHGSIGRDAAFLGPPRKCGRSTGLWQVGVAQEQRRRYFLVRWTPPFRFRMSAVRNAPRTDCVTEDPEADA
ncbi:MAG TPA: hypothetical protein DEH78_08480, partial [Solibacterales bacterium]|nr:hypothetical protein [Bryobacterales bacterium]